MDLRLAYAKARCSDPIHASRADVVRAALEDCTLLGHRFPERVHGGTALTLSFGSTNKSN
jgi:hypothetical protein